MTLSVARWKEAVRYILLATLPVVVLFGLAEGIARLFPGDITIQRPFFLPVGHEEYIGTYRLFVPYQPFRPYYWLPVPNTPVSNSRGFRGRDVTTPKPPGKVRIVCMGCSCTVGGQESYPERLERLLRESLGTDKYEVINGGAGANSTYQGLLIFQNHILELHPDIVTVYFGWNDRWVHDGRRDSQHRLPSKMETKVVNVLSKSKFVKALLFRADKWRNQHIEQRVPVDEYGQNLNTFVNLCRQRGIRIILCTTPDGMTNRAIESRFNSQAPGNWYRDLYLLFKDNGGNPVEVWNYIQRLYNGKVREVAVAEGCELLDLDALVKEAGHRYTDQPLRLFKDGIHFSELGLQEVAAILAETILTGNERGRLDRYLNSPEYCRVNAEKFMSQYQFAEAECLLDRAESLSAAPIADNRQQRAKIAAERPFYDQYYAAQFEISNQGDIAKAIKLMDGCLQMRPTDENLRLDLAGLTLAARLPNLCLNTVQGPAATYSSPENAHKALWLAVDAAQMLGRTDFMRSQLEEIRRLFPDDARAKAMLDRSG